MLKELYISRKYHNLHAAVKNNNEEVVFKNCASFTDCINKTNNTQIDNAKAIKKFNRI